MLHLVLALSSTLFMMFSLNAQARAEFSACSEDSFLQDDVSPLRTQGLQNLLANSSVSDIASGHSGATKALQEACPSQDLAPCPVEKVAAAAHSQKNEELFKALQMFWQSRPGLIFRRTSLIAVWAASIYYPAQLADNLTEDLNPKIAGAVIGMVVTLSGLFSYNIGLPLYRYAPMIGRYAMKWWNPPSDDHYGQSQAAINETERTVGEQATFQLSAMDDHLKIAGKALKRNRIDIAADEYVAAILQSYHLYRGSLLHHPSLIERVAHYTSHFQNIDDGLLLELKSLIIAKLAKLPQLRLPDQMGALELSASVAPILDLWFRRTSD